MNKVIHGDCLEVLKTLPDNSIDSIVTDPPYELGFMNKKWDATEIAYNVDMWQECLRVLKPGGHLLSFGGTRTYHRMACAIEDAGFEIRDQIQWLYGSGFPKSHDISKAIDKQAGVERKVLDAKITKSGGMASVMKRGKELDYRPKDYYEKQGNIITTTVPATPESQQWDGWGTCLKPSNEPIVVARKPLSEKTIAKNVLKWGTGGLNIDGCRIGTNDNLNGGTCSKGAKNGEVYGGGLNKPANHPFEPPTGRFPANIILDEAAATMLDEQSGVSVSRSGGRSTGRNFGQCHDSVFSKNMPRTGHNDAGGASRFFYIAKASKKERGEGNNHPTVKPIKLMEYLCRLITPPNGIVLDPFAGSGTTLIAAHNEGFGFVGIEKDNQYVNIINNRLKEVNIDNYKIDTKYE